MEMSNNDFKRSLRTIEKEHRTNFKMTKNAIQAQITTIENLQKKLRRHSVSCVAMEIKRSEEELMKLYLGLQVQERHAVNSVKEIEMQHLEGFAVCVAEGFMAKNEAIQDTLGNDSDYEKLAINIMANQEQTSIKRSKKEVQTIKGDSLMSKCGLSTSSSPVPSLKSIPTHLCSDVTARDRERIRSTESIWQRVLPCTKYIKYLILSSLGS